MTNLDTLETILDFAVRGEREAQAFYAELARGATTDHAREAFLGFAAEERRHEEKLVALREGRLARPSTAPVQDLRIADYVVAQVPHPGMTYAQALVVAMQREKAAFRLYSDLADRLEGEPAALLRALAQEEARHKLRFELEYDDQVLKEN